MSSTPLPSISFFFNDTATTEIYTLSLHDALPISGLGTFTFGQMPATGRTLAVITAVTLLSWLIMWGGVAGLRSEEHTSELQSQSNLVCRLLLEKKKTKERHDQIPELQ